MSLFKNRPLARAALLVFLGSLSAYLILIGGMPHIYVRIPLFLLATAFLLSLVFVRKAGLLLLISCFSLFVGFSSQILYGQLAFADIRALDTGRLHSIEGTIMSVDAKYSEKSICTVSVTSINGERAKGKLKLTIRSKEFLPNENDIFSCDIMLLEWADSHLYKNGVAAYAEAEECPDIKKVEKATAASILSQWRGMLDERLHRGADRESAALLSAILLGKRDNLDDSVTRDFRRTGLSHLLAISGLHLSILAVLLLNFLRRIGTPRAACFSLLFLFISVYAAIAGFPLSLLRSAGMLLLAELGRLLRLSADSVTSLFASVMIILLVSPGAVADIGLALSFLATLGILVALNFNEDKEAKCTHQFLKKTGFAVSATLAAILFTLLLSVLVFGEISLLSPLSNLLLTPFLYVLLLIGPCILVFPTLFGPIASFFAQITLSGISFLSHIPGIYIGASHPLFVAVAILFSALLIFCLVDTHLSKTAFKRFLHFGFAVLLLTLTGCHLCATGSDYALYTRTTGHEHLLLQSNRKVTLVGNGGDSYAASIMRAALQDRYITEIDTLVITRYTKETPLLITELTGTMLVHNILLCPSTSEYAAITEATAIECGVTVSYAQNGTQEMEGELSVTLRSDIPMPNRTEGFLLRFEHEGTGICYAPASIFTVISNSAIESFTHRANLIVIGSLPTFPGKFTEDKIPQDAIVVIGDPSNAPESILQSERAVLEPQSYLFSMK